MKKSIFTLVFSLFAAAQIIAQAPQNINFQAVARKPNGDPNANVTVQVQFIVRNNDPQNGLIVYNSGSQNLPTDACGMFTAKIGELNQSQFSQIDWANGTKFLEVKADGLTIGNQQMVSVPYALYAEKTKLEAGNSGISVNGNTISNTGDLSNTNEIQTLSINPSNYQLSISGTGGNTVTLPIPPVYVPDIAIFSERYGANDIPHIAGGGANTDPVAGAWNWRNINDPVKSSPSVSLNTNSGLSIITFNATGKYLVVASAPGVRCNTHKIRLVNLNTNAIQKCEGTSEISKNNDVNTSSTSTINCVVEVTSIGMQMKMEHWFEQLHPVPKSTLGTSTGIGGTAEKFATITIQKIE
jgi:hypothetical protein